MYDEIETLQHQLSEARENLTLIQERMSEYVLSVNIPLQLVKEKRRMESRIRWLERRIIELRPINVLREATKLVVGPVAQALTGEPWKQLRQCLLTQASRLPHAAHLDTVLMEESADDLIRLTHEVRIMLEAHHIEPNLGQLEALGRRAGILADHLIHTYRLEAGDAPELEALAAGEL
ncbi:MAG: hypothetical protein SXV54_18315 [Chloroflexota bacterium]|nr:hypothetical protein [Chloroflexota bacterium]